MGGLDLTGRALSTAFYIKIFGWYSSQDFKDRRVARYTAKTEPESVANAT